MAVDISLTDLASLQNETTAINAINTNNAAITSAFSNVLSLDGSSPNEMGAAIDMDSNRILNLPAPLGDQEPLRLQDLSDFLGDGTISTIPAGGSTGQFLSKVSNTDYDVHWTAQSLGASSLTGTTLASNVVNSSLTTVGTLASPTLTTPTVNGGSATALTGLSVRSTGAAFNVALGSNDASLTTNRSVNLVTNNGSRNVTLSGDLNFGGSFATSGASALTLTTTGATDVTLPTTGTLVNTAVTSLSSLTTVGTLASPVMTAPTLGAATATSLTFSPTTGGIVGTTTNDNAGAGKVGQYIESVVASASHVSLTTATSANLTSISLTAGDWDVDINLAFDGGATTTMNYIFGGLSTTSATLDLTNGRFTSYYYAGGTPFGAVTFVSAQTIPLRLSLSGTTTVYAVAQASFGVSTCNVSGIIRARRIR